MNRMNKAARSGGTGGLRRTTALSLFTAIIAVLSVLQNFVRFGPFPITLALAPIIVGAALYGRKAGAYLGGVFGVVTLITGIFGWDGGAVMYLLSQNFLALIFVCIGKGVFAGYCSGLIYELLAKKNDHLGVLAAGIVCPVANTGFFVAGMLVFFTSALESWAGGEAMLYYIIFGLTGINFLVELAVNLVLSSGITTIINYGKGRHR